MRSYLDILTELKDAVNNDSMMPKDSKKKMLKIVDKLFELLWPYSV